jgi:hypothetical protein
MVPCVIVIKNNIVDANILCANREEAQRVFLDKCNTYISNWDEYSKEDVDAVLEDGYEKFGNGSICLSWSRTEDEIDGEH